MHYLQTIVAEGLSPRYAEVSSLGDRNVWYEKQRVAMYFGGIQDNFEAKIAKKSEDEQFEIGYAPLPVCDGGWRRGTVRIRRQFSLRKLRKISMFLQMVFRALYCKIPA